MFERSELSEPDRASKKKENLLARWRDEVGVRNERVGVTVGAKMNGL
jgi:hypothetical protein